MPFAKMFGSPLILVQDELCRVLNGLQEIVALCCPKKVQQVLLLYSGSRVDKRRKAIRHSFWFALESMEHSLAQQGKFGAAIHHALDEL